MDITKTIIAITGAHGTGKTTAALELVAAIKREHPDKTVGYVAENVAFCPYPINQGTTHDAQLWMFTHHIQTELLQLAAYDIVVSDRSCVDYIAYADAAGFSFLAASMFMLARNHYQNYSRIIFHTIDNHPFLADDGFRDTDPVFQREIEERLLKYYELLKITGKLEVV